MNEQNGIKRPEGVPDDEIIIGSLRYCASFLRYQTEGKGSQRRVLSFLRERGPMTQRDILEEMDIRASSLSELLGKLEGRGFVTKEKSEADKRNYNVSITDDGIRALTEMQSRYDLSMSDLLSGLDEAEKARLAALLEKLRCLWRARADGPPPRHGPGHEHGRGRAWGYPHKKPD